MKAIVYSRTGGPEVLQLAERPVPHPGPGEVLVRVAVSGVNPTDWKVRRGSAPDQPTPVPEVVPNQDGAGVIEAVGPGVPEGRVGERVWLWEAQFQRPGGTGQEFVALPADHAVALPGGAPFELGASLGIPAITAHRCLTAGEGPAQLAPGALAGRTVLVAGGAGSVGHAAIELARWAGATVITTISSPEKGVLAAAAGAHCVVNYRTEDAGSAIRAAAPGGVDLVVEVAVVANAALDTAVLAPGGTVASYASGGTPEAAIPVRPSMVLNARWQFVLVYGLAPAVKQAAVAAVASAVADGALRVGEAAGLPVIRFPLEEMAAAHEAVEAGAVGKVLVDIG